MKRTTQELVIVGLVVAVLLLGSSSPARAAPLPRAVSPVQPLPLWLPVQRGGTIDPGVLAQWFPGQGVSPQIPLATFPPDYYDADAGLWWFRGGDVFYPYKPASPPDVEPREQVQQ